MSLKAVHLFLISVATLTMLGFSAWCFAQRQAGQGFPGDLALAIVSGLAGLGLIAYGAYFLKKTRNVSLM
jgi:multidrug transporter EmrE-like cation transporter